MDKCRLCLKNTKNVKCLFDTDNIQGISFAEMINSLANVKVTKQDGLTDQICLSCRRKTKEFWDFKLLVEKSYLALQENCPLKRLYFTNIYDVEFTKELIEEDFKKPTQRNLPRKLINNNNEPFNYNDTVIKKVSSNEIEPLSVIDFLNSIKEENENDIQDDCTYEVETDYDPDLSDDPDYKTPPKKKKTKEKKIKTTKENNKNETVFRNPIKPVFLSDYTLVPTKTPRKVPQELKSKDRLLICPYCGKMTKSLKVHMLTHSDEKPFKCDKCSSSFVLEKQLDKHKLYSHGSKVIKCDQCVASFTTKGGLENHTKNRHSTEKKHVCVVCNKAFKLKTHLVRHAQHLHSFGAKPIKCKLCPDRFNSPYNLKHHMRVHTGERPYHCEICSQPYSYKHDFNRHCLKKHGVCFSRRKEHVMNERVLAQERILVRDLMLRVNGVLKDDKPVNPFEGPQAAMAFDQMLKAIQSGKVIVDFQ